MCDLNKKLDILENSTMFHMSLGSKELFHSNFLHWISIGNWDSFLKIMHGLAGLKGDKKFWWEHKECDIEGYKGVFCPANNNLEVRREYNNFDLSIFILVSADEISESVDIEGLDGDVEVQGSNGRRIVKKWIPVLILENKMKSLPYEEQLKRYTKDAFEEWSSGRAKKVKEQIKLEEKKELIVKPNEEYSISFILLSLLETELSYKTCNTKESKRPIYSLTLESEWIHKTYSNLAVLLDSISLQKELDNSILQDYRSFVKALVWIAENDWDLKKGEFKYINKICPWLNKKSQPDKQTILRIDDIRQKVHYSQMQAMLMIEIRDKLCKQIENKEITLKRVNSPVDVKKDGALSHHPIICCSTNFLHNVGLLEIYVSYFNNLVGVQIQGNAYEHVFFDITKSPDAKIKTHDKLDNLKDKLQFFFEFEKVQIEDKNNVKYIETDKFPQKIGNKIVNKVSNRFEGKLGTACFGYYEKDGVIYQKVLIPNHVTIKEVINAIVEDLMKILKNIHQNTKR